MDLNVALIYDFLKKRKNLTKKAIAEKHLFCDPSQLSRKNAFNPECLFQNLFNLENEKSALYGEDESELLGAIKDFIVKAGLKNALEDIWDKGYKEFAIEFLRRANTQPTANKSHANNNSVLPFNDEEKSSNQVIEIFKQAIREYSIADFINCDLIPYTNQSSDNPPTHSSFPLALEAVLLSRVTSFLTYIKSKILISSNSEHSIVYQLINKFCLLLTEYQEFLLKNTFVYDNTLMLKDVTITRVLTLEGEANNYKTDMRPLLKEICGTSFAPPLPECDLSYDECDDYDDEHNFFSQFDAYRF